MFTWIRNIWTNWRATAEQKGFDRGYDFARRNLQSGALSEECLANLVEAGEYFDGPNKFDEGAKKALEDWRRWVKYEQLSPGHCPCGHPEWHI